VAGRSVLEYLTDGQKQRQCAVVVELMAKPPGSVQELVDWFLERV
jgi:hypothetical protein